MKKLLGILVLSLYLITPSQADDIQDFQIEGMSIGDSLLDYFSEEEIEKKKGYYPKSKEWVMFATRDVNESFKIFDGFQTHYKNGDKKYIMGSIDGHIYYENNNIKDCYKKIDEVVEDISKLFPNAERTKKNTKSHQKDKTGKSKVTSVAFWLKSDDIAVVECSDWSEEINRIDKLNIKMGSKEFINWINNKAY